MLARAAAAGAAAAGGQVLTYGLDSPVQGAWVSASRMLPISLFIEEGEERVFLHFFDRQGLPLDRALALGITNKSFTDFERQAVSDVIRARLPKNLDRSRLFEG